MSSGLDKLKFREGMSGRQMVRSVTVFQRELGPGFGWVSFASGISIGDARRLIEAEPEAMEKLAVLFDGIWKTRNAKQ